MEVGVAAAEHGEPDLIAAFNSGDVYSVVAQRFYAYKLTCEERQMEPRAFKALHPDLRNRMKPFVLPVIFNIQTRGLAGEFQISLERAEQEPKHKMALVFRWYLGLSSNWANSGEPSRKVDYQIWCGPAMGAFNEWVKGSFLEPSKNRRVAVVALNLMYGAAVLLRIQALRSQGMNEFFDMPPVRPLAAEEIMERIQ